MEATLEKDNRRLTFDTTGPSTLAMCPEDSLDQLFLEYLGNTVTYVMQDGKLYLNLFADAGNLVF
jgi:heat shock protein HslJ